MPPTPKKQRPRHKKSVGPSGLMILRALQSKKLLSEVVLTSRNMVAWGSSWSITWDSAARKMVVAANGASAMKKLAKSQEDSKYWRVNLGVPSSQPTN